MQAAWVSFAPDGEAADPSSWRMAKLGRPVSPLEVIANGSYSQHAVGDEGVAVRGAGVQSWETLNIRCAEELHCCTFVDIYFPLPCQQTETGLAA